MGSWRELFLESPLLQEVGNARVQNAILFALRRKFGTVPPDLEAQIRAVQVVERLNEFVAQVAISPDLHTFQAHLAPQ
jgi:hypothetical protein